MSLPTPKSRRTGLAAVHASQAGSWKLPGGQTLAEFALRAGILAPSLLTVPKEVRRPAEASTRSATGTTL